VITSKNLRAGLFPRVPFCFRRFAGGDPCADGAPAQPVAAADTSQIDSSPPRSITAQKRRNAEALAAAAMAAAPATTTNISSRRSSGGPELTPRGALSGVPQGARPEANHILTHARSNCFGGQWARPATGRSCAVCWAAILGTRQLNGLGFPASSAGAAMVEAG